MAQVTIQWCDLCKEEVDVLYCYFFGLKAQVLRCVEDLSGDNVKEVCCECHNKLDLEIKKCISHMEKVIDEQNFKIELREV